MEEFSAAKKREGVKTENCVQGKQDREESKKYRMGRREELGEGKEGRSRAGNCLEQTLR